MRIVLCYSYLEPQTKDEALKAENFVTDFCQAVLWTSGYEVSSRVLIRLASGPWSATFDGDPTVLPTGQKLPVEVPKLSVASLDERWRIQVGTSRVDVTWQRIDDSGVISEEQFAETTMRTLNEYLRVSDDLIVSRMAFITRRFTAINEPAKEIASYFMRDAILDGPLRRPNEVQINAHKVYTPAQLPTLNSWIRWRNGFVTTTREAVVTVEQDLNTLAESNQIFGTTEIADFLSRAPSEAARILSYYLSFPKVGE